MSPWQRRCDIGVVLARAGGWIRVPGRGARDSWGMREAVAGQAGGPGQAPLVKARDSRMTLRAVLTCTLSNTGGTSRAMLGTGGPPLPGARAAAGESRGAAGRRGEA